MKCKHCEGKKAIKDESGEYEARLVRMFPLFEVDLDTGEAKKCDDPPYFVQSITRVSEKENGMASFKIKFCPMCGKKLD